MTQATAILPVPIHTHYAGLTIEPSRPTRNALGRMSEESTRFARMANALPADACGAAHLVGAAIHRLCEAIRGCELAGVDRKDVLEHLELPRQIHRRSPFIRRLQDWPRGYPGDFETIEALCAGQSQAQPGTVEFYLERYALSSPAAQQHRNKIQIQKELIRSVLCRGGRVLSLACGSCLDLVGEDHALTTGGGLFVGFDQDRDALALAAERSGSFPNVHVVQGNVIRHLGKLEAYGPFDLVVAGGLFDYLPDKWATRLLADVRKRLLVREGGQVFITNIADPNPLRSWMSYLADWVLIERSGDDMAALFSEAGYGDPTTLDLRLDPTGLAWLARARC